MYVLYSIIRMYTYIYIYLHIYKHDIRSMYDIILVTAFSAEYNKRMAKQDPGA